MRGLILLCLLLCGTGAARATPPALMLASDYAGETGLHAFRVSEKLDGVRARWDGEQLISRQGNVFSAPAWFTHGFPAQPLDGELWMGRGRFADVSGAVRRQQPDAAQWRAIRFMVFDLPAHPGTFDERLTALHALFASPPSPHIALIEQFRVADRAELLARLDTVVALGGEGLMLHHGNARYRPGRSDALLKLKPWQDAEAVVIGHLPGKGRHAGRLGALQVENGDGIRFRLGTGFSDSERETPPPLGSVVTYRYHGVTRDGVPRFASFLRLHEWPAATPREHD